MIRTLLMVVLGVFAIAGVIIVLQSENRLTFLNEPAPAAAIAAPVITTTFEQSGTLTYYPNSQGYQVPYLVFKAASSSETDTKALSFTPASRCATPSGNFPCSLIADAFAQYYAGGPIQVVGTVADESVIVDSVSPS